MSEKSPTSTRRLSSIFAPLTSLNEVNRSSDFRFDSPESSLSASKYRNSYGYGERSGSSGGASASVTPKDMTLRSTTSSSSNQSTHSDQYASGCGQLAALRKISMGFNSMPNSPRMMPKQMAHTVNCSGNFGGALSTLTDHLNVQQVNKYSQSGFPEINWQERCLELQLELHRSKSQSERIRGMLRDKVSGMIVIKLIFCYTGTDGWMRCHNRNVLAYLQFCESGKKYIQILFNLCSPIYPRKTRK